MPLASRHAATAQNRRRLTGSARQQLAGIGRQHHGDGAVGHLLREVRIEGHTDDRGRDDRNLDLSVRRARSVRRWLIEHGIEASRLEAWGCGEQHPVEPNTTADGRQANRRVEFQILDPRASGAPALREGCVAAGE